MRKVFEEESRRERDICWLVYATTVATLEVQLRCRLYIQKELLRLRKNELQERSSRTNHA